MIFSHIFPTARRWLGSMRRLGRFRTCTHTLSTQRQEAGFRTTPVLFPGGSTRRRARKKTCTRRGGLWPIASATIALWTCSALRNLSWRRGSMPRASSFPCPTALSTFIANGARSTTPKISQTPSGSPMPATLCVKRIYNEFKSEFVSYLPVSNFHLGFDNATHTEFFRVIHPWVLRCGHSSKKCIKPYWRSNHEPVTARLLKDPTFQQCRRMESLVTKFKEGHRYAAGDFFFFNRFAVVEFVKTQDEQQLVLYWSTLDAPNYWEPLTSLNAMKSLCLTTRARKGSP